MSNGSQGVSSAQCSIVGSSARDFLIGDGQSNRIFGNAGNDVIIGSGGADTLNGGSGWDAFHYVNVNDSTVDDFDVITDFSITEGDFIDLSVLDADINTAGKQALVLSSDNSAAPGSVWYDVMGGGNAGTTADIFADVSGDRQADFKISLSLSGSLSGTDTDLSNVFILV